MATSIYPAILAKIQDTLEKCTKIKKIYNYPVTDIKGYPAAIYYPDNMNNGFETNEQNMKLYDFSLFIVVNTGSKSIDEVYQTVMPNAVDEVIENFDSDWDYSTIDGHRVWQKLNTGAWDVGAFDKGITVTASLNLQIKLLTNN